MNKRHRLPSPSADHHNSGGSHHHHRATNNHYHRESHDRRPYPQRNRNGDAPFHGGSQRTDNSHHAEEDVPPVPKSPTEEYLTLSSSSPSHLSPDEPPHKKRKLLVLDLNGTLVLRSSRPPASAYLNPQPLGPLPRIIYPRPYIPAFAEYIFHPENSDWLDTIVWSSAMPLSVADMVEKAFGERKQSLRAVWARDTLGLSRGAYSESFASSPVEIDSLTWSSSDNKVDTVKNLDKPWDALPFPPSTHSSGAPDADAEQQHHHSPLTTLLLDDSPNKARLQPWNHLCINEYTGAMRGRDEALWKKTHPPSSTSSTTDGVTASTAPSSSETYDETLLAVIGVLSHMRTQANVAAWVRSGGLFDVGTSQTEATSAAPALSVDLNSHPSPSESAPPPSADDVIAAEAPSLDRAEKRRAKKEAKKLKKAAAASSSSSHLPPLDVSHLEMREGPALVVPDSATSTFGAPPSTDKPLMWFAHPPTLAYWVALGRAALAKLGIDADEEKWRGDGFVAGREDGGANFKERQAVHDSERRNARDSETSANGEDEEWKGIQWGDQGGHGMRTTRTRRPPAQMRRSEGYQVGGSRGGRGGGDAGGHRDKRSRREEIGA